MKRLYIPWLVIGTLVGAVIGAFFGPHRTEIPPYVVSMVPCAIIGALIGLGIDLSLSLTNDGYASSPRESSPPNTSGPKQRQFTTQVLLIAIVLISAGFACMSFGIDHKFRPVMAYPTIYFGMILVGAGVLAPFQKFWLSVQLALAAWMIVAIFLFLWLAGRYWLP